MIPTPLSRSRVTAMWVRSFRFPGTGGVLRGTRRRQLARRSATPCGGGLKDGVEVSIGGLRQQRVEFVEEGSRLGALPALWQQLMWKVRVDKEELAVLVQ